MRIVKQNRFKNLGELHKEWTEAVGQGIKRHHTPDVVKEFGLQLSSEVSYLGKGEEELDCCPVVQSPLIR